MIVHQLNLANFRGFEQIELQFETDVTVIAGANGVGKSSILEVLAVLFSTALRFFTLSTGRDTPRFLTYEDISHSKRFLEASTIFTAAGQRYHVDMQEVRGNEQDDDGHGFWHVKPESGPYPDRETLQGRKQHPVVIYFSTKRSLPGRPRTLPKQRAFEIAHAYRFALQDREVDVREFMHWFRVVEYGASRAHGQHTHVLDDLRRVVTAFVPEFTNLRIEGHPTLRFVVDKSGVPLILNQLSDGERGLLAIIFDITRRLAIANPGLDDPIAEGKAIILIDEIELHLHPTWQRRVLRRFTETFKNCQFIVTTHSPQVLGEVEHRCIRYLLHEGDKIIAWTPQRSLGLDTSRVLEEIMDSKARNAEIEDALNELSQLIDDENFKAAKQRIEALQVTLGENDPELTRARALMAFLEGAE